MKRIAVILLALLLCGSLVSCAEAQNAQDAFVASPEGAMIGKTFREVEAAFGPFSIVFFEEEKPAAYVFNNSNVAFHFDAPEAQANWAAQLTGGTGYIPGAIALRDIQPTDLCIGVSGRIRDFGIADSDVTTMDKYMQSLQPASVETKANTVYTLTTGDGAYEVFVYCAHGETTVTSDHQIRVMTTGLAPAGEPAPEAQVTEFTFGGTAIPVGATEVEVRGESGARKKITAKEFKDLVRYCPELKSLVFDYCDLEGENQIGRLTELKKLEIMSCNLQDISFVEGLTKLTRLNVCHNRLFDLSAIEDLPLTFLNIADNPDLGNSDLRTVGRVTTLDTLYIYSLDISSLSPLKNLKRLYTLNVNNDSRITEEDLSDLYRITGLRKLQINGTGVTSLDFLFEDFPGLKELEARKMKKLVDPIVSFLGLAQHSNLTKLTISKDLKESMDEDANTAFGMDSTEWFKTQGITLIYK